ncbi:MAG: hypothetical protein AAF714_10725 [Pseudomonadota bacterium]
MSDQITLEFELSEDELTDSLDALGAVTGEGRTHSLATLGKRALGAFLRAAPATATGMGQVTVTLNEDTVGMRVGPNSTYLGADTRIATVTGAQTITLLFPLAVVVIPKRAIDGGYSALPAAFRPKNAA